MRTRQAQKTPVVVDDQSQDFELPEGWVDIELAEHVYVAGRIGWRGLKAEEYTPSGPILLSVPNLNYGDNVDFSVVSHVSQERYDESPEIQLRVGDTLLVKDGAGIGKSGYVAHLPGKTTVNSSLLVVRPSTRLLVDRFLFYYLKGPQFQEIALQRITGSGTPHLFQRDIKKLRVLVPPAFEQHRIVTKVEELLAQVNASRARLAKVSAILKRFRQAVLAAACSGGLTEDWREAHSDLEPAAVLIEHLRRQRQAQRKEGKKEVPEIAQLGVADLPELPDTWAWGTLDQLMSNGPQNGLYKPQDQYGQGVPIVRIDDFQNNLIPKRKDLRKLYATLEEARLYGLRPNDLLINRVNSPSHIGKCLVVPQELCPAVFESNMMRVTLASQIEPLWIATCLRSADGRARLTANAKWAVNQVSINQTDVRSTLVALPPSEEQHEIVRRVEALFKLADAIEKRVEAATKRVDKLTQAILAKAFRGELVPAEAELARREGRDYERASVLLARIQAEREKAPELLGPTPRRPLGSLNRGKTKSLASHERKA